MSDSLPTPEELLDRALKLPIAEAYALIDSATHLPPEKREEIKKFLAEYLLQQVDGYEIEELIGKGGMGKVYKATQVATSKTVALKLLEHGPERDRFQRQIRILQKLNHESIAPILDWGWSNDGKPYLCMDYIRGTSLDEYLDAEAAPLEETLRLFLEVCDGMAHAHKKGVIHRDLKPSNIMVENSGRKPRVQIIDFGLSKLLDDSASLEDLTGSGFFLGTPDYFSPEQVQSEELNARSDVYSLGVVAYELMAGSRPYTVRGLSSREVQRVILETQPKPLKKTKRNESIEPHLDWVVRTALLKDPGKRYSDAGELGADLQRVREGRLPEKPKPPEPPDPPSQWSSTPLARRFTAVVVVLIAVIGAAISVSGGKENVTWDKEGDFQVARNSDREIVGRVSLDGLLEKPAVQGTAKCFVALDLTGDGVDEFAGIYGGSTKTGLYIRIFDASGKELDVRPSTSGLPTWLSEAKMAWKGIDVVTYPSGKEAILATRYTSGADCVVEVIDKVGEPPRWQMWHRGHLEYMNAMLIKNDPFPVVGGIHNIDDYASLFVLDMEFIEKQRSESCFSAADSLVPGLRFGVQFPPEPWRSGSTTLESFVLGVDYRAEISIRATSAPGNSYIFHMDLSRAAAECDSLQFAEDYRVRLLLEYDQAIFDDATLNLKRHVRLAQPDGWKLIPNVDSIP